MSAEIMNFDEGVVTARVTGKLTHEEFSSLQQKVGQLIDQHGALRLLVVLEDFDGWQKAGGWGDLSFQFEHDGHIEKMAIVGDRKWQDLVLVFTAKGIRKFPIEYFGPPERAKAAAWLRAPIPQKAVRL